jgi:hypothetical protein
MRMTTDSRIKIAVQKSGRLTEHSLELLVRCGLSYSRGKDQLICFGENMPVDVLLVRDDDIPRLVQEDICDLGIVGLNIIEERLIRAFGKESKGIPEPARLEPDSPAEGKTLIVWGEQGIGDELMAGTLLEQARREFKEVIFECHPRLEWLHRRAHPDMRIYPTRKDDHIEWPIAENVVADYKAPLLDLAARYRPDAASFRDAWAHDGPPYSGDEAEIARYREQLEQIADGRPIVGLAMRGGVMQTARVYRTMRVQDADHLFENTDCLFVGLDYDDMSQFASYAFDKYGENRLRWFPSIVQHWDFHHTAALVGACDLVVTVCQSVAHLAAGMGKATRVLTPKRCAWRYALMQERPEEWFWYPDPAIKLYRQDDPESWRGPLDRVISDIRRLR